MPRKIKYQLEKLSLIKERGASKRNGVIPWMMIFSYRKSYPAIEQPTPCLRWRVTLYNIIFLTVCQLTAMETVHVIWEMRFLLASCHFHAHMVLLLLVATHVISYLPCFSTKTKGKFAYEYNSIPWELVWDCENQEKLLLTITWYLCFVNAIYNIVVK